MWSHPNDIQQRVLLIRRQVASVSLHKDQQALVPQHRQLVLSGLRARRVSESDKVEHERVDDLVRQGVLLVEQDSDEKRVGSRVVHACQSQESRSRVQDWDGDLGQD